MQDSKANEPYEIDVIDLCCHRVREKYHNIDSVVCYLGSDLLIPATRTTLHPFNIKSRKGRLKHGSRASRTDKFMSGQLVDMSAHP